MTFPGAALTVAAVVAFGYFVALNALYLLFAVIAWRSLGEHLHRHTFSTQDEVFAFPFTPGITVLLPAFNEEQGIVDSVRSLLALRYPLHEIIVINDGSADRTLERLREEFQLVPAFRASRATLRTALTRGTYISRRHRNLWVIDKENAGKPDALNTGINAAHYDYVCAIDADSVLDRDALLQVVAPILDDPGLVVATGGIVRIANGCVIKNGQLTDVRLPAGRIAVLQVIEYFRAFLIGRVAWTRLNALLIVSGAFGLFQRAILEDVGGYWTGTVADDVELVIRIHRYLRRRRVPYRVVFVPEPVCWTEAPESLRGLAHQRRRWHRGFGEALWRHRAVFGNPAYGSLGLLAFPYFAIFEFFGPVVEVAGILVTAAAFATGRVSLAFLIAFLVTALLVGIGISIAALVLEEFNFRRHPAARDVARMIVYSVVENLGARQFMDACRALGIIDLIRGRKDWGSLGRSGIGRPRAPLAQVPEGDHGPP
jgi:cellulose synthase/poly-beta-1,6-N-acetylglucosamine synthase-like glycosyltransferase